jgi:hypothetical protein
MESTMISSERRTKGAEADFLVLFSINVPILPTPLEKVPSLDSNIFHWLFNETSGTE